MANKAGEVVGIIFDGNIQSLPWNFMYSDAIGRSVAVDARGITEALRNIYGAPERHYPSPPRRAAFELAQRVSAG